MGKSCTYIVFFAVISANIAAKSIDYIYIDASEGSSSGGHAAIQFDRETFHFQYTDPGIIRLFKNDSGEFEFLYRYLDNRTLHVNSIEVSEKTFELLRDYFNFRFLAQHQQFALLDDLQKDRSFLQWLTRNEGQLPLDNKNHSIRLKGAGLFFSQNDFESGKTKNPERRKAIDRVQQSAIVLRLRQRIGQRYGQNFLSRKKADIKEKILRLNPTQWNVRGLELSYNKYPPMVYPLSSRYVDLLTGFLALKVLEEARPLAAHTYSIPKEPDFELTGDQLAVLGSYQEKLLNSVVQLLKSERPEWGFAVMVNTARLIALGKSMELGRLVVIDTFESGSLGIEAKSFGEYAIQIQSLLREAQDGFHKAKIRIRNERGFSEWNYSVLEKTANRYLEIIQGLERVTTIRLKPGLIPTKSIDLPNLVRPGINEKKLASGLKWVDAYESVLLNELKRLYRYDLFTRNCVTEIFWSIDQALAGTLNKTHFLNGELYPDDPTTEALVRAVSVQHLGGHMDNDPLSFIPATSFQLMLENYSVSDNWQLPAYRKLQLQELYRHEHPMIVYLREANTLSSTLYQRNEADSFFLFFTDDTVLFRPLFGAINTVAGLSQSVLGLFMVPFDAGKTLYSGVKGITMSVPELFFFNIRKGSYKLLSYQQLMPANAYSTGP